MGSSPLDRPVTVALVEDWDVVADGVRGWIAADPGQRAALVSVATSVEDVLDGPGRTADVLVLDLELGPNMVTDRVVADLSDEGHRVIVYSMHYKPLIVEAMLKAGACLFLDKKTERDRFVDAVVAVAHDEPFVTPSMAGALLQAVHLSRQEQEVLRYLFQGMSHAAIGHILFIATDTVGDYLDRARAKFAAVGRPCRSNTALLARCIEQGFITPQEVDDYRTIQPGT
jgi:two-component system, NarL family, nitrate/nitrite response regulator NarL